MLTAALPKTRLRNTTTCSGRRPPQHPAAFFALALTMLLLAGCTLPGVAYHPLNGLPRNGGAAAQQSYTVQAITPALLVSEARAREHHDGIANPVLKQSIGKYAYRVGAQDVLNIVIWDHPELTLPQGQYRSAQETGFTVQSDGTIFYPYVGSLHVAGETTEQIRRRLVSVRRPHVEVPRWQ